METAAPRPMLHETRSKMHTLIWGLRQSMSRQPSTTLEGVWSRTVYLFATGWVVTRPVVGRGVVKKGPLLTSLGDLLLAKRCLKKHTHAKLGAVGPHKATKPMDRLRFHVWMLPGRHNTHTIMSWKAWLFQHRGLALLTVSQVLTWFVLVA